jgi:hypothetical protein
MCRVPSSCIVGSAGRVNTQSSNAMPATTTAKDSGTKLTRPNGASVRPPASSPVVGLDCSCRGTGCGRARIAMGIKQKNLRILSSKILLGTWCTTPAFDSYFLESAEKFGFGKKTFSDRNIRLIMNSIYQNRESFLKNIQNFNKIYKKNIYTDVRIVDLLMWKSNF